MKRGFVNGHTEITYHHDGKFKRFSLETSFQNLYLVPDFAKGCLSSKGKPSTDGNNDRANNISLQNP